MTKTEYDRIEDVQNVIDAEIIPKLQSIGFYRVPAFDSMQDIADQKWVLYYHNPTATVVRLIVWVTDLEDPSLVADCTVHDVAQDVTPEMAAAQANAAYEKSNLALNRVIQVPLTPRTQRFGILGYLLAFVFELFALFWFLIEPIISAIRGRMNMRSSRIAHRFIRAIPKLQKFTVAQE